MFTCYSVRTEAAFKGEEVRFAGGYHAVGMNMPVFLIPQANGDPHFAVHMRVQNGSELEVISGRHDQLLPEQMFDGFLHHLCQAYTWHHRVSGKMALIDIVLGIELYVDHVLVSRFDVTDHEKIV
jgi:hypothetical protein